MYPQMDGSKNLKNKIKNCESIETEIHSSETRHKVFTTGGV